MRPSSLRLPYQWALALSLFAIIPLGYWVRFAAPVPESFRDILGGIVYQTFWILCLSLVFPFVSSARIAIAACLVTCAMEFLQLWQNPVYKAWQTTFLGRLFLGNTFSWSDFPNYLLGSWVGWLYVQGLQRRF